MAKSKKSLGDILIENKIINYAQLQEALRIQNQTGDRLGRVLVNLGFVTEQDIANVLEVQLGITQVKLGDTVLVPAVMQLIPENLVRQHKVIPIKKDGNKLSVAMIDPLNVIVLDDLQIATGMEIEPVLATDKDINSAIQKYFGFQELMGKASKEFEVVQVNALPVFNLDDVSDVMVDEAPTVRIVNSLIQQAIKEKASDIHIEPKEKDVTVRYRIDGLMRKVMVLPRASLASVVSRIKIMADMDIAERRIPLDGRIQVKEKGSSIDLRVSSLPTIFGEKIVIRVLDKKSVLLKLDDLGMSPEVLDLYKKVLYRSYGMILVTGPTGSGKTTTLYSSLQEISTPEKNILTIEDPVEYVLDDINQIWVNQKAGLDFATGLRAILRQDPDIVMVGEIRDGETADIAVRAATTGHLVLTTLHTNDAAGALPRLIDMGVEPFLVASSVIGVLAQRLVRIICPKCKEAYSLGNDTAERTFLGIPNDVPITLYRGKGCSECGNTGYKGRKIIQEFLPITKDQRILINAKASSDEIWRMAIDEGMITLKRDGIQKALSGLTTVHEVMRVATTDEE